MSESTLTDRYQTTIPKEIRLALGLSKKDKIIWMVYSDGTVRLAAKTSGGRPVAPPPPPVKPVA